jgi:hypothetical protein
VVNYKPTAWFHLRIEMLDRFFGIWCMLNYTKTKHDVVLPIRERQLKCIGLQNAMIIALRTGLLIRFDRAT